MLAVSILQDMSHCDCSIGVALITDAGESDDSDCVDSNVVAEVVVPLLLRQLFNDVTCAKFYKNKK